MDAVVDLTGIHKRYGPVEALSGIDLRVEAGEVVALLGGNGAGKTTTFEVILGLVAPTAGRARVLGCRPGGSVRTLVGAMLQGAGLPELVTVVELVTLVGRSYPDGLATAEALGRVGLADRADRMVTTLSGGERQRLLLAMAIIGSPRLLVLDEPTAGMDLAARDSFWAHVGASAGAGTTVLVATHHLDEADRVAERVVVLDAGRVVADTTPAELKARAASTIIELTTDAEAPEVLALPAVTGVDVLHGLGAGGRHRRRLTRLQIRSTDAEASLRALLRSERRAADLRVGDATLEDAIRLLTRPSPPREASGAPAR